MKLNSKTMMRANLIIWVSFFLIILVLYMTHPKPAYELKPFVSLDGVKDAELIAMEEKKSENEGVTIEGNFPKFTKGGKIGVLLVHGLSASPFEMSFLHDYLVDKGFTVYNARVAGHGAKAENAGLFTYEDWYSSLRYGYFLLKNNCDKVYVVGQSNGGLLATAVATLNGADGLILLAPAFKVPGLAIKFVSVGRFAIKDTKRKKELKDEVKDYYYPTFNSETVYQMVMMQRVAMDLAKKAEMPILIFQNEKDNLIDPKGASEFYRRSASNQKELVMYGEGDFPEVHVLTYPNYPLFENTLEKIENFIGGGKNAE